ncbi:hypothetical protein K2P97_04140 [bacterium]|nr:hypothetical protein [bacterium]
MTVNPLPPQAYTKETLQKAYTWLLTQGPSVKEMASTQDMLVSLYLKAQRSGEASLDTPSIQNFKQELKNLASMIGDLQTPQQAAHIAAQQQVHSTQIAQQQAPQTPVNSPQASVQTKALPVAGLTQTIKETTATLQNNGNQFSGSNNNSLGQLDLQSLQILAEVRQNLNLSSDIEALRALISLGYKQFKKMN